MQRIIVWFAAGLVACQTVEHQPVEPESGFDADAVWVEPEAHPIDSRDLAGAPYQLRYAVDFEGRPLHLELTRNDALFAPGYTESRADAEGHRLSHPSSTWANAVPCWYVGDAVDADGARHPVAVRTCTHGAPSGLTGWLELDGAMWELTPRDGVALGAHDVRPVDVPNWRDGEEPRCGVGEAAHSASADSTPAGALPALSPAPAVKKVEWYIVNDAARCGDLGDDTETSTVDLANATFAVFDDAGFSPRIELILKGQHTQHDGDPWWQGETKSTADAGDLLESFSDWADGKRSLPYRDTTHLFAHRPFRGSTIGTAWVGGMCTGWASSAVVQATLGTGLGALTAAHEMGHSLDALHDGYDNDCDESGYVMQAYACSWCDPAESWSECSISEIDRFNRRNTDCLDQQGEPDDGCAAGCESMSTSTLGSLAGVFFLVGRRRRSVPSDA